MRKMGEISLSYYLMHSLVYIAVQHIYDGTGHEPWRRVPLGFSLLPWVSAILVGWALTNFIERPLTSAMLMILDPGIAMGATRPKEGDAIVAKAGQLL